VKQARKWGKRARRWGRLRAGNMEGFDLMGDVCRRRVADPRARLPQAVEIIFLSLDLNLVFLRAADPRALHLSGVDLLVGEGEGKTCAAGSCGDDFFIVLVATTAVE
jgi:hypothetical protein